MTTETLRQVLEQVLKVENLPEDLTPCHTAIGYLPWSQAHLSALAEKPVQVWGGVFCLSIEEFEEGLAETVSTYGLTASHLLGEAFRVDIQRREDCWRAHVREAAEDNGYTRVPGFSIIAELPRRFPYFTENQALGPANHLDTLGRDYQWIHYHHSHKPHFWTFEKSQPTPEETP